MLDRNEVAMKVIKVSSARKRRGQINAQHRKALPGAGEAVGMLENAPWCIPPPTLMIRGDIALALPWLFPPRSSGSALLLPNLWGGGSPVCRALRRAATSPSHGTNELEDEPFGDKFYCQLIFQVKSMFRSIFAW